MISISWHLLLFIVLILALLVRGLFVASEERGLLAGIGCLPHLLLAFILFLIYGGIFWW